MRKLVVILMLLMLALPVVGAQDTQTVTMIVTRDPISFDPHGTLDPGAPVILAYIYDTLVYQAADGSIFPSLATDWTVSDDGLTVTFVLREDVVFSSGDPVNADAVIFTFERLQEMATRSLIFSEISNITAFEKVSDYEVTFQLENPSATLMSALTYPYAGILNPASVEAAGEAYGENPDGTGPFMLSEWIPESSITLVPNPNYAGHRPWVDADGAPAFDELVIQFNADQAARANALLAGQADMAYLNSAPQLQRFADSEDFYLLDSPGRSLVYIGMNTAKAPFDDVNVRRAIAHAINKQEIVDFVAEDGLGEVVNLSVPPTVFGYTDEFNAEADAYDLEAAQAALEAAGYNSSNPLTFTILTSTFPTFQDIATIMQAQLAPLGIEVEVEVLDFSAVSEMAANGEHDMLVSRYDWNDPDVIWRYLSSENIGRTNRFFYDNADVNRLTVEARQAFDPQVRFDLYRETQEIVLDEVPWIPVYMPITKVVVSNRVADVDILHSHIILDVATVNE